MKFLTRASSLLLSLLLLLSLSVPALAEDPVSGTITVDNAVVGQTYSVYRLLSLESYDDTNHAYSYRLIDGSPWNAFLTRSDIKGTYLEIDASSYVTWKENASASAFAAAARAYLKGLETPITPDASTTAATTTVSFTGLPLGYYFMDSSLGVLTSLDTMHPDATIKEKNSESTLIKHVQEKTIWGEKSDAKMGDTVNYKSVITVGDGCRYLVYHDTMSEGLTFDPDSVTITSSLTGAVIESDETYTVKKFAQTNDGCTFEIVFSAAYLATQTKGSQLQINYSGKLNDNALINDPNNNTAKITYGEGNRTESKEVKTETYTYQFDLVKTDVDGKLLTGATFYLYDAETGGNQIPVIFLSDDNGIKSYRVWPDPATAPNDGKGDLIEAGQARIEGLDSEAYYLEEETAPQGYNRLTSRVKVDLTGKASNLATVAEGKYVSGGIQVKNQTGTILPGTGGMGTKLFTIGGASLILLSLVLVLTGKTRKKSHR